MNQYRGETLSAVGGGTIVSFDCAEVCGYEVSTGKQLPVRR